MSKMKKRMNTESLHIEYLNQTLKKDCDFILDEDQMAEGEIKIRELKETHANVGSQKSLRAWIGIPWRGLISISWIFDF